MTYTFFYAYAFCAGFYLCAMAALLDTENARSFVLFKLIPFLFGFPMAAWAVVGLVGALS